MKTPRAALALLLTLFAALSFAQAPLTAPKEITDLSWAHGDWEGKIKFSMAGMPESEGAQTWKVEPEGQFLKMTTVTDMMGMKMTEIAYLGWNADSKRYDCWTFTNFAPTPRVEHGTIDDKVWTFLSEPWTVPGMPGAIVGRATMNRKSDKEMTMLLEFKEGDKWVKQAEGSFTKKS